MNFEFKLPENESLRKALSLGNVGKYSIYAAFVLTVGVMLLQTLTVGSGEVFLEDLPVVNTAEIDPEDEEFFLRKTSMYDNYHRCQNKLGYHFGELEFDQDGTSALEYNRAQDDTRLLKQAASKAARFAMASFNDPGDIDQAVSFVLNARRSNLRPIVEIKGQRMALQPQVISQFYQRLSEATGDSIFIATIASNYQSYVDLKNSGAIQSIGGGMAEVALSVSTSLVDDENILLATPVFKNNSPCSNESFCHRITDEFQIFSEFLVGVQDGGLGAAWFDYYLLSFHNFEEGFATKDKEIDADDAKLRASYAFEDLVQELSIEPFNEKYDVFRRAIIVDFGPNGETTRSETQDETRKRLMYDYGLMSDNPLIEGIVLGEAIRPWFGLANMDRLHLEGTNCNYDQVDYQVPYASQAKAPVCEANVVNSGTKAKTRVVCAGETAGGSGGNCVGTIRFTMKVGLPILHCGSNSVFGTDTRPYIPPSVAAAKQYPVPLDYLNQNASVITTNANENPDYDISKYAVPWLNNCFMSFSPDYASALPKQASWQTIDDIDTPTMNLNGSLAEVGADRFSRNAISAATGGSAKTPDEKYFVWGRDIIVGKDASVGIRGGRYSSLDYAGDKYKEVNKCGGDVQFIVDDPQNYVYGDEIVVDEVEVFSKGANQLAYEVARGELDVPGVEYQVFSYDSTNCQCAPINGVPFTMNEFNLRDRSCALSKAQINGGKCIKYTGGLDSYEESRFEVEASFPDFPEYDLEGAYDALAAAYNRVQTELSKQGLKLIINTKTGWKSDMVMKAYSVPPFFNDRVIPNARENLMLETLNFNGDTAGVETTALQSVNPDARVAAASSNSCQVGVNFAVGSDLTSQEVEDAVNFGYAYGQILITGNDADADAAAMSRMCDQEMVPILRYCYKEKGVCAFTPAGGMSMSSARGHGADLAAYYKDVYSKSTCGTKDVESYFVCGHNEPVSEFAGLYFPGNRPTGMQVEGSFSRGCVDAMSGAGDNLKVTTSIFNATIGDGDVPDGGPYQRFEINADNYAIGYGGESKLRADISEGGPVHCVALNTYSNVPADVPDGNGGVTRNSTAGDHYSRVTGHSAFSGAPTCVMEVGWGFSGSPEEQSANAEAVIDSLTSTAGNELIFYLYFNATGSANREENGQLIGEWVNFTLNPSVNADIGGGAACRGISDPENTDYQIPGVHIERYNMHLAEGDHFARAAQYYEYLENINYLHYINTLYSYESSQAATLSQNTVGLPHCSDLPAALRTEVDCLALATPNPAAAGYVQDPLGRFLCDKGYNIVGQPCDVSLVCSENPSGSGSSGSGSSATIDPNTDPYLFPVGSDRDIPNCSVESYSPKGEIINVDLGDLEYRVEPGYGSYAESQNFQLVRPAANAFKSMMEAMRADSPSSYAQCALRWGYRTPALQSAFGACGSNHTACACQSEHQLGTTLDFIPSSSTGLNNVGDFSSTGCYTWLNNNAHNYGFVRTYKPNNPDGYIPEPWHWRWIPRENALEFHQNQDDYGGHLKNYLVDIATTEESQGGATVAGGVCPISAGYCIQGPEGDFSHRGNLNAVDLKQGSDLNLYAPFDGRIVRIRGNYCRQSDLYHGGDGFYFEGRVNGQRIQLQFYHAKVVDASGNPLINVGDQFRKGEVITQLISIGERSRDGGRVNSFGCQSVETNNSNQHLHLEYVDGDIPVSEFDMMAFSNALGCGSGTETSTNGCSGDNAYGRTNDPGINLCVVPGGEDSGGLTKTREYSSLNDLIRDVANSITNNYLPIPPEALKAIMRIETSLVSDITRQQFTGDQLEQGYVQPNSVTAAGPMQFTEGAWNVVLSNSAYPKCLTDIGLQYEGLTLGQRTYVGPALCGAAIKLSTDVNYSWPGDIIPLSQWGTPSIGPLRINGMYSQEILNAYPEFNTQIAPIHVAGYRYYGACFYRFTNNVGSYCQQAFTYFNQYSSEF